MEDLIKALQLIWKYFKNPDTKWPTACEHDTLYVGEVKMEEIPVEDIRKIADLGFNPGIDDDYHIIKHYLGEDFASEGDYTKITSEQWDLIKDKIYGAFNSYRYSSY